MSLKPKEDPLVSITYGAEEARGKLKSVVSGSAIIELTGSLIGVFVSRPMRDVMRVES